MVAGANTGLHVTLQIAPDYNMTHFHSEIDFQNRKKKNVSNLNDPHNFFSIFVDDARIFKPSTVDAKTIHSERKRAVSSSPAVL